MSNKEDLIQEIYTLSHTRELTTKEVIERLGLKETEELLRAISNYRRTWVGLEPLVDLVWGLKGSKTNDISLYNGVIPFEDVEIGSRYKCFWHPHPPAYAAYVGFLTRDRSFYVTVVNKFSLTTYVHLFLGLSTNDPDIKKYRDIFVTNEKYGVDKLWHLEEI